MIFQTDIPRKNTGLSANNTDRFRVRYKYGDIKPSKEIAKVLTSQKFKQPTTESISVTDYEKKKCPGKEIKEISVNLTSKQLEELANAIGRGDPAGVAVVSAEIVVGVGVETIKSGKKIVRFIERTLGIKF